MLLGGVLNGFKGKLNPILWLDLLTKPTLGVVTVDSGVRYGK